MNPVAFDWDCAQACAYAWGFNCGPAALCAVLGMTPESIRPHLMDFERKGYTNPTLMEDILRGMNVRFSRIFRRDEPDAFCPDIQPERYGLMRVQWGGRWTNPGVPMPVRYRHTHWVGLRNLSTEVFDINAICAGGWLSRTEWREQLVPWLIRNAVPCGDGSWWPTHVLEIGGAK